MIFEKKISKNEKNIKLVKEIVPNITANSFEEFSQTLYQAAQENSLTIWRFLEFFGFDFWGQQASYSKDTP